MPSPPPPSIGPDPGARSLPPRLRAVLPAYTLPPYTLPPRPLTDPGRGGGGGGGGGGGAGGGRGGGVVGRVGKLVFVKPLRARYRAEVGDVVVGCVAEVRDKRWKVELRARQEGVLMLSAVSLPGDVQRRRTQEDELSMRSVFREGDVVCAEVQQLYQDGAVVLHTRSAKYGKLEAGRLVQVDPVLIRRLKQHFVALPELGLFLVLGCNGYVWVGKAAVPEGGGRERAPGGPPSARPCSAETRARSRGTTSGASTGPRGSSKPSASSSCRCTLPRWRAASGCRRS